MGFFRSPIFSLSHFLIVPNAKDYETMRLWDDSADK